MRATPELVYLAYLVLVAWGRRLPPRRRVQITAIATADFLLLWWLDGPGGSIGHHARAWMPLAQILVCYWMSGLFFVAPMRSAERVLAAGDRWLFQRLRLTRAIALAPRWSLELLELAYLSVYPILPLGFAVALALDPALDSRAYWTPILVAELVCYGVLPWVQTRPPRALHDHTAVDARKIATRRLNTLVLSRGSIQVNTFPSGHAAGALATTLVVAGLSPVAGAAFAVVTAGIVAGSIVGRYHYAVDSLAGLIVALVVRVVT